MLLDDFCIEGAKGAIEFHLKDFRIVVDQNNVVGNIVEEWLAKWMLAKG